MPARARWWLASNEMSPPSSRMAPPRRCARPTSSSSSVVLPTPLRPRIASVSPRPTRTLKSSTTRVGPQPPWSLRVSSMGETSFEALRACGAEVDGLHLRVRHHLPRLAGDQQGAIYQHRHLGGEAPHDLHV